MNVQGSVHWGGVHSVGEYTGTVFFRQWLFRRRRQFALGIYFAAIIHVCLYSRICSNYASDTVV